eukprot:TRINITY_DN18352_c0_g1_i1.p1 TRINITY_DN18352_c0_g1~~TRINITY_DN18352_c0_g1_i1.p1  ORF type:complete len:703 (+),score=77.28 TRINITY_DN18352_c0_g1_i1:43-2109(+)
MKACRTLWRQRQRVSFNEIVENQFPEPNPIALPQKPKPPVNVNRPPKRDLQSAYLKILGDEPLISKVNTASIESVKYGARSEKEVQRKDRDVPHHLLPERYRKSRVAPENIEQVSVTYVNPYQVPDIIRGTDQCPGCGALMQNRERYKEGYTSLVDVKRHIENHDRQMKYRESYNERQRELHELIDKNGWHDEMAHMNYMTEAEYHAVHVYQPSPIICERCTHLRSHTDNDVKSTANLADWQDELQRIKNQNALVVLVVSLWDFENTLLRNIRQIAGGNPILLVGTFADTIPLYSSRQSGAGTDVREQLYSPGTLGMLSDWMELRTKNLNFVDQIACGNVVGGGQNIELVAAAIHHWATRKMDKSGKNSAEVFLVGSVNAGKSSLMNNLYNFLNPPPKPHPAAEMMTDVENKPDGSVEYNQKWMIPEEASAPEKAFAKTIDNPFQNKIFTVSQLPGTTLRNMSFQVRSKDNRILKITDTPGVVPRRHMSNVLPLEVAQSFIPVGRPKPKKFKLTPGSSLFVSALVRIDLVKGPSDGVFFTTVANWKNTQGVIVETREADIYYEKWKGVRKVLSPPTDKFVLDGLGRLCNTRTIYQEIGSGGSDDIVVNGLCFFSMHSLNPTSEAIDVVVKVSTVKGLSISNRRPIINYSKLRFKGDDYRSVSRKVDPCMVHLTSKNQHIPMPLRNVRS